MKQKQPSTDWPETLQPLVDMAMINFSAAQKCVELQSNFISYLMDANLKQLKTLVDSQDPKSAMACQLQFIKEVDSKWCDLAEQEIETTRDAQQSITGILEKNIRIPDLLESFNNTLNKH